MGDYGNDYGDEEYVEIGRRVSWKIVNVTHGLSQQQIQSFKVMCNHNFNIFLNQDSNIYSKKKFAKTSVHVNTICRFFSGKFYGYLRELYLLEK